MKDNPIKVSPDLLQAVKELCDEYKDVVVVCLCTTDGFSIMSVATKELKAESDKLAAMSSTIASLSDSSIKQVLNDKFDITIIESVSGNALFVSTTYLSNPCVLTVVARDDMSLATARYKTKALAEKIAQI